MQIFKKKSLSGGTPRLIKSLPCSENFFLSLTNDIFVICNLKVIKNDINTYHNINFDKKLSIKYSRHISGWLFDDSALVFGRASERVQSNSVKLV